MRFARAVPTGKPSATARTDAPSPGPDVMNDWELTPHDLQQIAWACAALSLPDPLPEYMQDFIALRLDERAPETAVKVRRLSREQMNTLGDYLRGRRRDG